MSDTWEKHLNILVPQWLSVTKKKKERKKKGKKKNPHSVVHSNQKSHVCDCISIPNRVLTAFLNNFSVVKNMALTKNKVLLKLAATTTRNPVNCRHTLITWRPDWAAVKWDPGVWVLNKLSSDSNEAPRSQRDARIQMTSPWTKSPTLQVCRNSQRIPLIKMDAY